MKNIGNGLFRFPLFVLAATILVIGSLVIVVPIVVFGIFRSISKRIPVRRKKVVLEIKND